MEQKNNINRINFVRKSKDLEVYKEAFEVSIEIHKLSLQLPKIEQYEMASQIRRASKSICSNISEGFVRQVKSKQEFIRFLVIAAGSAQEVITWLEYCYRLEYINVEQYEKYLSKYEKIFLMINNFINKIEVKK